MNSAKVDVYVCDKCEKLFAVELDQAPKCCPICASEALEFSHETEVENL